MNRTCSEHSTYMCQEPKCQEEYRTRRQHEELEQAQQAAASTLTTILAIDIATGLI